MKREPNDPVLAPDTNTSEQRSKLPVLRPCFQSAQLFGSAREVVIEHDGQEYRLRLTRHGKLVLTK